MKYFAGILLLGVATLTSALFSSSDDVVELNPSNFNSRVIQSDELWLVEFYAPWCGHCKSLAPEWKKAAKALKGVVNIAAVDADAHNSLGGQYGVKGFPTIKVFGANKNSPTDYNGQRTAQGIVDTALAQLKTLVNARLSGKSGGSSGGGKKSGGSGGDVKDVVELTDANFEKEVLGGDEMVLVEFFAPWCGHCKSLAPHWAQAATELKGKVKIAALDATEHTVMASRFGVRGYPTIKYFPAGKKDMSDVAEYDGGRTASDIVSWALEKFAENIPPPEVVELTEESSLTANCEDKQLCIVSILPHILDCQSKCRNDYLQILRTLGEKYKKKQWGWTWAEAGAQMDVEKAFGIGGFGYPAMAAVHPRKMKYVILKGAFSESGLTEFMRELSVGRGSTAPIKDAKLPSIVKASPWDGKDGEMPVEDEYDLSDVDLDDLDDVDTNQKVEL